MTSENVAETESAEGQRVSLPEKSVTPDEFSQERPSDIFAVPKRPYPRSGARRHRPRHVLDRISAVADEACRD
ncbi:hypothetical protein GCM10018793_07060 [Streptomyces sulfonofaciens]|uniref:Uncharacterized protein n=1 Tax=Streptomyces sulfonofaciens TaxID=68272 RepID=A0A919FT70_9ACTN|nr:hypothetical protein GCM10018793_07060 [Streptomyces sulfonofaciens]